MGVVPRSRRRLGRLGRRLRRRRCRRCGRCSGRWVVDVDDLVHRRDRRKEAPRLNGARRRAVNDLADEHLQAAERPDAEHRSDARNPARAKNEDSEPSSPILLRSLVR